MRRISLPISFALVAIALLAGTACLERSMPTPATDAGSPAPPPPATATTGTTAAGGKKCPTPDPSVICTKEYKPVVCDGCAYANSCIAGAAGFKAEQCVSKAEADAKKVCPDPAPGIVCTMEYAPVKCDGCLYPNSCTAGAAGFTKEQCVPALGED